ncbi:MAG: O-antigen ligase family protein [Chloroflexota bacterium]
MKILAKAILWIEPLLLAVMVAAFWFSDPSRVNFLLLLIPPALARLILYRRLWLYNPLNVLLYVFIAFCVLNTFLALAEPTAPYSWGWYMIGRPLMGVALVLYLISRVNERGSIDDLVLMLVLLAILVGVLGLSSAQFTSKSNQLQFFVQLVPQLWGFPGAERGFNVNEIGGAMAFFAPLAAGIAIHDWRYPKMRFRRAAATLAFVLLSFALFLGQSRLAIFGVVAALGALAFLLIPAGRWRYGALTALVIFCALEGMIIGGVFAPQTAAASDARDEASNSVRLEIWGAGLAIVRDYPLTGVGLNKFRSREVRDRYPVPDFGSPIVPHTHNEILQVGTDLGIPGMVLFIAWNATVAVMIWKTWRKGTPFIKAVAVSAGAGLLAHTIFGLADAITLFDRFIFAYWLLVALAGGAYVLANRLPAAESKLGEG